MVFKIEKGLPIPEAARAKYPFRQMEVGDSFLVPDHLLKRVYTAASWYGTRNGKRFAIRKTDDGLRCWRFE